MDGLIVIDKPVGPTSHDIVARMRRTLGERRIGHTGTLDPGASGVLPLVVGRATRLARFLAAGTKRYDATVVLGISTDTYDSTGTPVGPAHHGEWPGRAAVDAVLATFRGAFHQQPPIYSAKKLGGRRSYRIARAAAGGREGSGDGVSLSRPAPAPVTVYALELVDFDAGMLRLRVECSAGFYVRALAHELGERLHTGAHLGALRRTGVGELTLADAVPLAAVEIDRARTAAALIPMSRMLPGLGSVVLTTEGLRHARHGCDLGPTDFSAAVTPASGPGVPPLAYIRLLDQAGDLVGVGEPADAPGLLHPSVVLM
jgi:tRNA pseudouridine55 synthase